MSEIDIVIPQDTNPIEITTPTATEETEVQAEETQNNTSYNVGGDAYYTDLAKDWAIKMNGKVLGQDYSSKYWAYLAQEIEQGVAEDTENAHIWAEGTDAQVQALGGEHSSKGWVNYVLTNPPLAYVTQTETGCTFTVTDINGTTTADLLNGQDGQDGAPGADGQDGADGFSPIATVTKSGDTATISITDKNGTTTATISDGQGSTVDQTFDGTSTNAQSGVAIAGKLDDYVLSEIGPTSITHNSSSINLNYYDNDDTIADSSVSVSKTNTDIYYSNGSTTNEIFVNINGIKLACENSASVTLEDANGSISLTTSNSNLAVNGYEVATVSDIPTVNNSSIVFQKNGTSFDTITLNQSSNDTINISVPTDTGDLTNGAGFITGINSSDVITALGYTPYSDANPDGFITGIDSTAVTTALGYTPYNSTNPDGYITSSALSNYVTTNTAQTISGRKTFTGEKAIYFKQSSSSDKLGFTLYNSSSTELGAFEYRPNTISNNALIAINTSYANAAYVGFRYWGTAVNVMAPKPSAAGDYYIPINITDGTTTVTAANTGTVNISSLLPTVPTNISAFTNDSGYITSAALNGYATQTWVGQQGYITGITSNDVTTALGYTPYNSSNPSGYQANVIETIKVNGTSQTVTSKAVDITVPTVNNPTITFTQGGVTKGSITLNQASNDTIALDAGGGGGSSSLSGLSDVTLTSPSSGEALCYDGSDWINSPKTLVTIRRWS